MPPETATNVVPLLLIAISTLAGAVVVLFRMYTTRLEKKETALLALTKAHAAERAQWAVERTELVNDMDTQDVKLRLEYETRHREISERYAQEQRRISEDHRDHEDGVRREYADNMEAVATEAGRQSAATIEVMNKLYERFIGPRPRR